MKADARRDRARRDVVRSAESGQEVIERLFVGQIDDRQTGAQLIFVCL